MTPLKATVTNVIPSLRYADAAKAIDWLCAAFGFERAPVVPGEDDLEGNVWTFGTYDPFASS